MFRIERKRVPKPVADRKHWAKFGDAAEDVEGPDPATTKIADDVFLTLTTNITVSVIPLSHASHVTCHCMLCAVMPCRTMLPSLTCKSCDMPLHALVVRPCTAILNRLLVISGRFDT